jgi:3-hydroxymyristoyl/3-hydroxydecanoyl-(acyl carrier protein) dehydratase
VVDRVHRLHRVTRRLEADDRLFAGHFPGQPILPGIAHLALLAGALGEHSGSPAALLAVRQLRLRRPVLPGETIELAWDEAPAGGVVKFELQVGGAPSSSGTVERGASPAHAPPGGAVEEDPGGDYPGGNAASALVPHRPPALLVRAPWSMSGEGLRCRAVIPGDSPFAVDGRAPSFVALEAAAQAAALFEALRRRGQGGCGGTQVGYLVGIRNARFDAPFLPACSSLDVTVALSGLAPPLAVYDVSVALSGHACVTGSVSTFIEVAPA